MSVPRQPYTTNAVHCPHCGAQPGQPCKAPGGDTRRVDHSERNRLAYALMFPMDGGSSRADAERYRMKYPDVDVRAIVCAPSRSQAMWWNRWGRGLRYDRTLYESEHGPDTSGEGGDENECSHPLCRTATTPVATCGCACGGANHGRDGGGVEEEPEEDEEYVGMKASDLLSQFDKIKPVDTVSKMTRDFVKRNRKT
jgi:hypothetical protein